MSLEPQERIISQINFVISKTGSMISIVVGHVTLGKAFLSYLFGRIVLLTMIFRQNLDKQLLLSSSNLNSSSSGESIFQHEHLQFLFLFIRKLLHVVRSQSELCYSFLFSQFLPFFSFQASAKEKKHKEMPVTKQEAHLQPSLGWVLVKEIKFFLGLHCSHC